MILCSFTLLYLINYVSGHASMYIPPPRSAGAGAKPIFTPGSCNNGACMWFSQGCTIGCACNEDNTHFHQHLCDNSTVEPLVNDPKYRTFNRFNNHSIPFWPADWTKWHPWRYPGTSVPLNPCGLSGGSTKNNDVAGGYGNQTIAGVQGFPGTELPPIEYKTTWKVGSVVDVAWGISANHGGGYLYRLCPKDSELTEDCFMKMPLKFHGDKQTLVWSDGHEVEIDAVRISEGVYPENSVWTKNPIPACDDVSGGFQGVGCDKPQFPPPTGCNDTCWGYQPCFPGEFPDGCPGPIKTKEMPGIVDKVEIPADLKPGEYTVGFRWDCEQTPQIWQFCGDVNIV